MQHSQQLSAQASGLMDDRGRSDADNESLLSLTPSLAQQLYRTSPCGVPFQALNDFYFIPVDNGARQIEELHILLAQTLYDGRLYREPEGHDGVVKTMLDAGGKVLDVGSGLLGAWTKTMASEFPASQCIGIDLVPNEAKYAPPNCHFEVWDVTEGLPYPAEHFALIHASLVYPFVPDFAGLVAEMQRCLKPGGILCLDECEATLHFLPAQTQVDFLSLVQKVAHTGLRLPFATSPRSSVAFADLPRVVSDTLTSGPIVVPAFDFVHELTVRVPIGVQDWMNPKEALLSTIKQKIALVLWEMLSLDPSVATSAEARERLAGLKRVTEEGGTTREEGPLELYTSLWARKRIVGVAGDA